jgi:hypothetical protein
MEEGVNPQLARNLEFTVPTTETLARMYIKNPPYMDKNHDEVRATPIKNISWLKRSYWKITKPRQLWRRR